MDDFLSRTLVIAALLAGCGSTDARPDASLDLGPADGGSNDAGATDAFVALDAFRSPDAAEPDGGVDPDGPRVVPPVDDVGGWTRATLIERNVTIGSEPDLAVEHLDRATTETGFLGCVTATVRLDTTVYEHRSYVIERVAEGWRIETVTTEPERDGRFRCAVAEHAGAPHLALSWEDVDSLRLLRRDGAGWTELGVPIDPDTGSVERRFVVDLEGDEERLALAVRVELPPPSAFDPPTTELRMVGRVDGSWSPWRSEPGYGAGGGRLSESSELTYEVLTTEAGVLRVAAHDLVSGEVVHAEVARASSFPAFSDVNGLLGRFAERVGDVGVSFGYDCDGFACSARAMVTPGEAPVVVEPNADTIGFFSVSACADASWMLLGESGLTLARVAGGVVTGPNPLGVSASRAPAPNAFRAECASDRLQILHSSNGALIAFEGPSG